MNSFAPSLAHGWPPFLPGAVWLVGAGPGDPDLLTLRAARALAQADVVVHDALIPDAILALAPQARLEAMGKRRGGASARQDDINARLITLARAGLRVLRLKGGDPFVFGRGGEEALALAEAGIAFHIVPGITAGIGGLAAAGIPVTHRGLTQAVTFITGHDQSGDTPEGLNWPALAMAGQMLVIYMGLAHAGPIAAKLLAAGRAPDTPCAVVSHASLPTQEVLETRLDRLAEDLAARPMPAPALLVIGANVGLRAVLAQAAPQAPWALAAE